MSNFAFLQQQWPELYDAACKAELLAYPDPRTSCFYARRGLELAVQWLYKYDGSLKMPYQDNLSALIYEPTFRDAVGHALHAKARVIKDLGNLAVHSRKPMRDVDAVTATRELFHFAFWIIRTYSQSAKPADDTAFDPGLLPKETPTPPKTIAQLQTLEKQLADKDATVATP